MLVFVLIQCVAVCGLVVLACLLTEILWRQCHHTSNNAIDNQPYNFHAYLRAPSTTSLTIMRLVTDYPTTITMSTPRGNHQILFLGGFFGDFARLPTTDAARISSTDTVAFMPYVNPPALVRNSVSCNQADAGKMKRALDHGDEHERLCLVCPDRSKVTIGARRFYGRGDVGLKDGTTSCQQFAVSAVEGVEGVCRLEAVGMNPICVEISKNGEWESTELLEKGSETLVQPPARFYVASKMNETTFEVKYMPHDDKSTQEEEEREGGVEPKAKRIQLSATNDPLTPFSLLKVRGLAEKVNTGSLGVSLKDLVSGPIQFAFISNYMIDFPWLLSACPDLVNAKETIIVHGERDANAQQLRQAVKSSGIKNAVVHAPPLPVQFGTHHTKAFILGYATGLRLVIHTANLIYVDCNNKAQGVYWQDFPKKEGSEGSSEFERDLVDYLKALKLPVKAWKVLENWVTGHDFSAARVKLVASIPGYHKGNDINKYGHMRVRHLLKAQTFPTEFKNAPIVCQFSSLGSLDGKWLNFEFRTSMGSGKLPSGGDVGLPELGPKGCQLVWPTVLDVRESLEGWAAGYSIPGHFKNVTKPFLSQFYHRYGGDLVGRQRAMPHIKTYTRYNAGQLAWVMLASHNLSKAAWGSLQKQGSQLMIRSYELGVIFLPHLEMAFRKSPHRTFSCMAQNVGSSSKIYPGLYAGEGNSKIGHDEVLESGEQLVFRTVGGEDGCNEVCVRFPLPYKLPPPQYSSGDAPWRVDQEFSGLDALGQQWGVPRQFYGMKQEDD